MFGFIKRFFGRAEEPLKGNKLTRIQAMLKKSPDMTDLEVAVAVGCHPSFVSQVRTGRYAELQADRKRRRAQSQTMKKKFESDPAALEAARGRAAHARAVRLARMNESASVN